MKRAALRPQARQDRRNEIIWYRQQGGPAVAHRLVAGLAKATGEIEAHPAIVSPRLGQALGVEGLRTWRIDGFPLSWWYFERFDHVDIVRLVGHRQDPSGIDW